MIIINKLQIVSIYTLKDSLECIYYMSNGKSHKKVYASIQEKDIDIKSLKLEGIIINNENKIENE